MRRRMLLITMVSLLLLVPSLLLAQERFLNGRVVFIEQSKEPRPAVGLDVTIEETRDTTRTKVQGLFRIRLRDLFRAGEKVTLLIEKQGWRIEHPLNGQHTSLQILKKTLSEYG